MTNEGNQSGLVHGGEGAVKAIQKGEPFHGLASAAEQEISHELALAGRAAMVHKGAQRLEAATRLYWAAFVKAAEDGDIDKVDRYAARFGWLQSKALLAWMQSRAMAKDEQKAPDIEAIRSKYVNTDDH